MSVVRFLREKVPFGLVMVFLAVLLTPIFGMATPARADICSTPPAPANPWTDQFSRIMAPPIGDDGGISVDPQPDPLKHEEVPLYKWYGTNYKFFAYDASCNWGTDLVWTAGASTDSALYQVATYPFAIAYGVTVIAMADSWKDSLDSAVEDVTATLGDTMFAALATIVITVAGLLAIVAARSGDVPKVFGQFMWVVCLIGVAALSIGSPQVFTQTADEAVSSLVTTAGKAVPAGEADKEDSVVDPADLTAMDKATANLDAINRDVYFRGWLQGQLGDADGVAAKKHGDNLFRATHLTWWEGRTVQLDPEGAGQDVLDRKETLFKDTVDAIEEDDPAAFEHIKGQGVNRLGTVVGTILQAWLSLPFYIVAMIAVGVALVTIRIVVMLLPMLTLAGMMEPARMWMLGVLQKYSKNVIIAPLAFAGAIVYITVVGALFRGDLPMIVKVFLSVVVMIVLWTLIKPPVLPGAVSSRLGSMVRRAASTAAGIKLAGASRPDEQSESGGPETSQRSGAGRSGGPSKASRPVAGAVGGSYIGDDRQLPASVGYSAPGTEVAKVNRPAAGTAPNWVPVTRVHGVPGPQEEAVPSGYAAAAGTSAHPRGELPAVPSDHGQRNPNPWLQDAPTPSREGGSTSDGTDASQRSVPVVYTAPLPTEPQERPDTDSGQSRPVTVPEGSVPQTPHQEGSSGGAGTYTQGPQEVPVRSLDDGQVHEPDAVWMPESHRPAAAEHEGVSEANLARDENGNQTFVVWLPESSQGGEQR
ncbi:MAG: hypothetical protein L0G46_05340 [Kocuria sp.]|nr:hypothetical protein [Kocuria sp.]